MKKPSCWKTGTIRRSGDGKCVFRAFFSTRSVGSKRLYQAGPSRVTQTAAEHDRTLLSAEAMSGGWEAMTRLARNLQKIKADAEQRTLQGCTGLPEHVYERDGKFIYLRSVNRVTYSGVIRGAMEDAVADALALDAAVEQDRANGDILTLPIFKHKLASMRSKHFCLD